MRVNEREYGYGTEWKEEGEDRNGCSCFLTGKVKLGSEGGGEKKK